MSIQNAITARLRGSSDGSESVAHVIKALTTSGRWSDHERCEALLPLALRSSDRSAVFHMARWLMRSPAVTEQAIEVLRDLTTDDPAASRLLIGNLLLDVSPISDMVRDLLRRWPPEPALLHVVKDASCNEALSAQLESGDPEQIAAALAATDQCTCLPSFGHEIFAPFGEGQIQEKAQLGFVELMCKFYGFDPPLTDDERCAALAGFAVHNAGDAALAEISAWLRTSDDEWLARALGSIAATVTDDDEGVRRARNLLSTLIGTGSPASSRTATLVAGWVTEPRLWNVLEPLASNLVLHVIQAGDAAALDAILANRPNVNLAVDVDGFSALHRAALQSDPELVRCLLAAGADPDLPVGRHGTHSGQTALQIAVIKGAETVSPLLLQAGARTDVVDSDRHRRTLLHLSAIAGTDRLVRDLIAAGQDPGSLSHNGSQPLHTAARHGNVAALRALLDAGVSVDAQNDYGKTALHYAAEDGHLEAVKLLVDADARCDLRDKEQELPADVARTVEIQRHLCASMQKRGPDPVMTWLREAIVFYRSLHFFQDRADLSDDDLLDDIQQTSGPLNTAMKDAELGLLVRDRSRVWVADYYGPEIGSPVSADAQRYREALKAFSSIGRKKVSFTRVEEKWAGERGPITVSLDVASRQHVLRPEYLGELFDIGFVNDLNRALLTARHRFALFRPAFMELWGACFVLLTEAEQRQMEQVRGCRFYSPEEIESERESLRALAAEEEDAP